MSDDRAPLGAESEHAPCINCDDRRCMDCVFRIVHDACVDDCPECCSDNVERMRKEAWESALETATEAILKLNAPRSEGGMGFRHTHFMARRLARAALESMAGTS